MFLNRIFLKMTRYNGIYGISVVQSIVAPVLWCSTDGQMDNNTVGERVLRNSDEKKKILCPEV